MSNLRRHQRLFHSSDFNSRPSQLWKWWSLLAAHFGRNCSNVRWLVFPSDATCCSFSAHFLVSTIFTFPPADLDDGCLDGGPLSNICRPRRSQFIMPTQAKTGASFMKIVHLLVLFRGVSKSHVTLGFIARTWIYFWSTFLPCWVMRTHRTDSVKLEVFK